MRGRVALPLLRPRPRSCASAEGALTRRATATADMVVMSLRMVSGVFEVESLSRAKAPGMCGAG